MDDHKRRLASLVLVTLIMLTAACALVVAPVPAILPRPITMIATPSAPTETPIDRSETVERDITYCTDDGVALKMDVFYPQEMTRPAPAVVYVHGGSWSSGARFDGIGMADVPELLARGYLVIGLDYRHAPEWKFPAQIQDVKCAIRFLRANAARFNLDPNRIGVWGHSAGGHLVLLLGLTDKSDGFDNSGEYMDQSSRVQAVVDLSGRADLKGMPADKATSVFGAPDNSSNLLERGSPVTFVTPGDAPFLIFHGDKDTVVPVQVSVELTQRLEAAGVPDKLVIVENGNHMFQPSGGAMSPTRAEMTKIIADFFDQYLR